MISNTKNKPFSEFARSNLNGVSANVSSGNLDVYGSIEEDIHLEFNEVNGLICYTTLQFNSGKIGRELQKLISYKNIKDIDELEIVQDKFSEIISNHKVMVGRINCYNIKSFSSNYIEGKLKFVYITHENNSITKINIYS